MEIHPSALKHGVPVEDIEHAVRNAMVTDDLDDGRTASGEPITRRPRREAGREG